jgi:LysM repeat protein
MSALIAVLALGVVHCPRVLAVYHDEVQAFCTHAIGDNDETSLLQIERSVKNGRKLVGTKAGSERAMVNAQKPVVLADLSMMEKEVEHHSLTAAFASGARVGSTTTPFAEDLAAADAMRISVGTTTPPDTELASIHTLVSLHSGSAVTTTPEGYTTTGTPAAATSSPPSIFGVNAGAASTTTSTPAAIEQPPAPTTPTTTQSNETLEEIQAEQIVTSTTVIITTTWADKDVSDAEAAAEAMVETAAASLKAFNEERSAAAKTAVWMAASAAAQSTESAAAAEKDAIAKGLDAVKKGAAVAKDVFAPSGNLASFSAFTPPPSPQNAQSLASFALGSHAPAAMMVPMTQVSQASPALSPTAKPPFALTLPTVQPGAQPAAPAQA